MASEPPAPIVDPSRLTEVARDLWVIGDGRVPLVPNIGIIRGEQAVLVVDTGMGPANGEAVLAVAKEIAGHRPLIVTLTHFHPEHGFGVQAFKGHATIVYNAAQRDELALKGAPYLSLFRGMDSSVAGVLDGTVLVAPDVAYAGSECSIDLGGRSVTLQTFGQAHTKGDQVVLVPDAGTLFVGDLAEERIFPIFPWFPPNDMDIDAAGWITALRQCENMRPQIVVPGHGGVGGTEILAAVRGYMETLRDDVDRLARQNRDADSITAELKPKLVAQHPDWDAPEWIDFAVRTFLAQRG